jgi:hypothetical protein
MSKRAVWLPLVGLTAIGAATLVAWAQNSREERIAFDQVPEIVMATILREAAGAEIKEIEIETENGRTTYEAEFVRDGKTVEITVAPDGTLLEKEVEGRTARPEEQEREVAAAEVPPAALAALEKLAAGAKIAEFAEEIEHGSKFYEGSWKAASGNNVDALVTPAGDLVELEEQVAPEQVPAAVLAAVRTQCGADASLFCEKKTQILYEIKFRKNGERHEILYTPDARVLEEDIEKGRGDEDD